jgi:hypothetical protein
MERVCNTGLVWAYATDLNGIRCVRRTASLERRAVEGNDVIPPREDEIANKTFISIDNEVSSKLFRFFMVPHEFRRREGT